MRISSVAGAIASACLLVLVGVMAVALASAPRPPLPPVPPTAKPNLTLTPGVARGDLTVAQICTTKWGHDRRAVTEAMKISVFRRYGFTGNDDPRCTPDKNGRRCEIDHLISRELGGADDVNNLWPQPYGGDWGASDKDRVENRLHVLVCAGKLDLRAAQDALRTDWIAAYRQYVEP